MKKSAKFIGGVCILSLLLCMQWATAQEGAGNCPKVMIVSKNLSLSAQGDITCDNCIGTAYNINRSGFTLLIKLASPTTCDETQNLIPPGSTLKVRIKRITRIDKTGACANVERGSFYNVGGWTLNGPTGALLFQGDVYRGTVGTNPQASNRCCNRMHEEVFIEGKGAASTTTGFYFRAMAVIEETIDLKTCKYTNWKGKLDGVLSQE